MINGYKIIHQNKQEILYIYLDFNYEFSGNNENKLNFFDSIKKLVKNIDFKGKKIFLVASGIIIGTLLINPVKINRNIQTPSYNYVTKIIIHDFDYNNLTDYEIDIVEQNSKEKGNIIENKKNNNVNTTSNINVEKSNISSNNTTKKNTVKTEIKDINKNIKKETKNTTNKEKKTQVTIYRSNGIILKLELEEYLIGVVGAEMPASFNLEALKAQAVVARTYALRSIKSGHKLTDTESTQSYKDNTELKRLWGNQYEKYYQKIVKAINETKGKTILYNGEYIDAVYHSTSNGKTENSINVWGNDIPYLKSVDSSWDKNVKSYERISKFTTDEFYNILSLDINEPLTYEIIHNETGRVRKITINNKTYSGTQFRTLLKLRSTDFKIDIKDENITITTYGYGHGVGMSQYGAGEMAKKGYNYSQILRHYYSGVVIK